MLIVDTTDQGRAPDALLLRSDIVVPVLRVALEASDRFGLVQ
jgi:hypothetical protein